MLASYSTWAGPSPSPRDGADRRPLAGRWRDARELADHAKVIEPQDILDGHTSLGRETGADLLLP